MFDQKRPKQSPKETYLAGMVPAETFDERCFVKGGVGVEECTRRRAGLFGMKQALLRWAEVETEEEVISSSLLSLFKVISPGKAHAGDIFHPPSRAHEIFWRLLSFRGRTRCSLIACSYFYVWDDGEHEG